MTLPLCEHRGDEITLTAPGSGAKRQVFECYQIHVRGTAEVGYVAPAACEDCGLHNEAFDSALQRYQQPQANFPTVEEYAERHSHCQTCPLRTANFCLRAMGTCSLTRKLEKCDFECPLQKFGKIERPA